MFHPLEPLGQPLRPMTGSFFLLRGELCSMLWGGTRTGNSFIPEQQDTPRQRWCCN
jgi:hypothetical protein